MDEIIYFTDVQSAIEEAEFCSQMEQQKYVIVAAYGVMPKKSYTDKHKMLEVCNFNPETVEKQPSSNDAMQSV